MNRKTKSVCLLISFVFSCLILLSTDLNIRKSSTPAHLYDDSPLLTPSDYFDWEPEITQAVGANPSGIFIGDANNDGEVDLVISNENNSTVSIIVWNQTSRVWNPQITKSVGSAPRSVSVGDVNRDGQNDIVTVELS